MAAKNEDYRQYVDRLRREKPVYITGVDQREMSIIRAALKLYRDRNAEKHTEHPNMGWGEAAKTAEELEIRMG